ncbi:MAG: hypothetical protein ACE144_15375 [Thermodesulfobacteriota bacterium]
MKRVFVNDKLIHVLPGMTVKHALMIIGMLKVVEDSKKVYDEWGNEVGLDGTLSEGAKLYVR